MEGGCSWGLWLSNRPFIGQKWRPPTPWKLWRWFKTQLASSFLSPGNGSWLSLVFVTWCLCLLEFSQSPGVSCAHDWGILLHSSLFSDWLLCRLELQSFQASALFLLTVLSCCLLCVPTMITVTLLWAESEVDYRVEFVAYSPIIDHSSSLMTVDVGETGLIKKYNLFLSWLIMTRSLV